MNAYDFYTRSEYAELMESIQKRLKFIREKEVRIPGGYVKIHLHSEFVSPDMAKSVWKGEDYIVHLRVEYKTPETGFGGEGHAVSYSHFTKSGNSIDDEVTNMVRSIQDKREQTDIFSIM